ncbi:hypothetical protein [Photobacterium leiognathi]|uniref:hypothetical protein n=1 Tax=Photobacterium leiognathi TaxID=553611 RepID=UPI002739358A|nr:hypothetical protein [Photobacterium leiognathi]
MKKKTITGLIISALLTGCGGGGDGKPQTENPSKDPDTSIGTSIFAMDGLFSSKLNTPVSFNIKDFVVGDWDKSSINISTNDPDCRYELAPSGKTSLTIDKVGRCDFMYSIISNSNETVDAKMTLVSTKNDRPILSPISTTTLVSQAIDINILELIKDQIPAGYSLSPDFIVESSSADNKGFVTKKDDSTITFMPTENIGWNYIAYTVVKGEDAYVGYAFVSIADEANAPPAITNAKVEHNKRLDIGETVVIDLSSSDYGISDDSGVWQLSYVQSFGATVTPVNPDSVENKRFTFTAPIDGVYDVAYIVSDHDNSSTMGIIRFFVGDGGISPTKPWTDITANADREVIFRAPPILSEAMSYGDYDTYNLEKIDKKLYQVSTFSTLEQAESYCGLVGGRVPTLEEMKMIYENKDSSSVAPLLIKWPKALSYITTTRALSLADNMESEFTSPSYLACTYVKRGIIKATPDLSDPVSTYKGSVIAGEDLNVGITLADGGDPESNQIANVGIITDISTTDSGTSSCTLSDDSGNAACTVNISKTGTQVIKFAALQNVNWPSLTTATVEVIPNVPDTTFDGANVDGVKTTAVATYISDKWSTEDQFNTLVKVTLRDLLGNPVNNYEVNAQVLDKSVESNVTTASGNNLTDTNGEITFKVSAKLVGRINLKLSTVDYDDSEKAISDIQLTYTPPLAAEINNSACEGTFTSTDKAKLKLWVQSRDGKVINAYLTDKDLNVLRGLHNVTSLINFDTADVGVGQNYHMFYSDGYGNYHGAVINCSIKQMNGDGTPFEGKIFADYLKYQADIRDNRYRQVVWANHLWYEPAFDTSLWPKPVLKCPKGTQEEVEAKIGVPHCR